MMKTKTSTKSNWSPCIVMLKRNVVPKVSEYHYHPSLIAHDVVLGVERRLEPPGLQLVEHQRGRGVQAPQLV